jgi:hypothetical protein
VLHTSIKNNSLSLRVSLRWEWTPNPSASHSPNHGMVFLRKAHRTFKDSLWCDSIIISCYTTLLGWYHCLFFIVRVGICFPVWTRSELRSNLEHGYVDRFEHATHQFVHELTTSRSHDHFVIKFFRPQIYFLTLPSLVPRSGSSRFSRRRYQNRWRC